MTAGAGAAAGPTDCNGTATITSFYATAHAAELQHDRLALLRDEASNADLVFVARDRSNRAVQRLRRQPIQ